MTGYSTHYKTDIGRLPQLMLHRGADKSLARPWQETSHSDQAYNTIPRLMA